MSDNHFIIQVFIYVLAIAGVFYSIILHEIAHGYTAKLLGDDTAEKSGRLSLNPFAHVDLYGTIILPIVLFLINMPIFGWAKPVPVNPSRMENPKLDYITTSLAGPITNLTIAVVLGLLVRYIDFGPDFIGPLFFIIKINLMLMIFNFLPIPPLDGSKLLSLFLPEEAYAFLEQFGIYILLGLIIFSSAIPVIPFVISNVVGFFFQLITGQQIAI